jgi:hypothetical protein
MAHAVGPKGVVYGQNTPDFSERWKAAFEANLRDRKFTLLNNVP